MRWMVILLLAACTYHAPKNEVCVRVEMEGEFSTPHGAYGYERVVREVCHPVEGATPESDPGPSI